MRLTWAVRSEPHSDWACAAVQSLHGRPVLAEIMQLLLSLLLLLPPGNNHIRMRSAH